MKLHRRSHVKIEKPHGLMMLSPQSYIIQIETYFHAFSDFGIWHKWASRSFVHISVYADPVIGLKVERKIKEKQHFGILLLSEIVAVRKYIYMLTTIPIHLESSAVSK